MKISININVSAIGFIFCLYLTFLYLVTSMAGFYNWIRALNMEGQNNQITNRNNFL